MYSQAIPEDCICQSAFRPPSFGAWHLICWMSLKYSGGLPGQTAADTNEQLTPAVGIGRLGIGSKITLRRCSDFLVLCLCLLVFGKIRYSRWLKKRLIVRRGLTSHNELTLHNCSHLGGFHCSANAKPQQNWIKLFRFTISSEPERMQWYFPFGESQQCKVWSFGVCTNEWQTLGLAGWLCWLLFFIVLLILDSDDRSKFPYSQCHFHPHELIGNTKPLKLTAWGSSMFLCHQNHRHTYSSTIHPAVCHSLIRTPNDRTLRCRDTSQWEARAALPAKSYLRVTKLMQDAWFVYAT